MKWFAVVTQGNNNYVGYTFASEVEARQGVIDEITMLYDTKQVEKATKINDNVYSLYNNDEMVQLTIRPEVLH